MINQRNKHIITFMFMNLQWRYYEGVAFSELLSKMIILKNIQKPTTQAKIMS